MGTLKRTVLAGIGLVIVIAIVAIISYVTSQLCPQVLANLSANPDAKDALNEICKSIAGSTSKMTP